MSIISVSQSINNSFKILINDRNYASWEIYDNTIAQNTKISLKTLEKVRKEHKEWYMTAEEALKLGVIDEII